MDVETLLSDSETAEVVGDAHPKTIRRGYFDSKLTRSWIAWRSVVTRLA